MEYTVIRSKRRSIALEITSDLRVVVRAPWWVRDKEIERFVQERKQWIVEHYEIQKARQAKRPPEPTAEEEARLRRLAAEILPKKVAYYAALMGVTPTNVRITSAKKRFGSCSGKNGLCFSWRLMQYAEPAVDYVVVHELAHIRHHNHSADFYAFVKEILPDYKLREKMLKR